MRTLLGRPRAPLYADGARTRRRPAPALLLALAAGIGAGCSTFEDTHYFRSFDEQTGESTNYFRLKISGYADFSSARYVSGYYDERAVDLFFNEMRVGPAAKTSGTPPAPDKEALFTRQLPDSHKAGGQKIEPLNPGTHGAFVMILSTDATAVANAIGQFSESNVVAESITNLINRDKIVAARQQQARQSVRSGRAAAVAAELDSLVKKVPSAPAITNGETEAAYLRALNAIGAALGRQSAFKTAAEADAWLKERRTFVGGQG